MKLSELLADIVYQVADEKILNADIENVQVLLC